MQMAAKRGDGKLLSAAAAAAAVAIALLSAKLSPGKFFLH
jgi:hypothetical protein